MKAYRTPLILVGLIVLLGLLAYWDEWKTKQEKEQETHQNRLLSGEVDQVTKFVLEKNLPDEGQLILEMEKKEGEWRIVSPIDSLADSSMVQTTLQNLLSYRYERRLEEVRAGQEEFGLKAARYRVHLEFADEKAQTLAIGNNLPVGYSSYVQLGESEEVLTASQSIATVLNKGLYDFRSKKFAVPPTSDLQLVEFQNQKGEKILLSRDSTGWVMTQPEEVKADQDELEELLREVRQTTIREFLDQPSPAIREALSLNNPGTELLGLMRFTSQTELPGESLLFLKNGDDLYARWEEQERLHRVDQKLEALFQKSSWDFRYKDVFSFDSNQVEKLVIDGKSYEKRSHNWYLESEPDSPTFYDHVRRFLIDLEYVKAKELLDEEAIKKRNLPDLSHKISLKLPGNVEIKAEIWHLEAEDAAIIKKSDDPTFYLVGSDVLDDIAQKVTPSHTDEENAQES